MPTGLMAPDAAAHILAQAGVRFDRALPAATHAVAIGSGWGVAKARRAAAAAQVLLKHADPGAPMPADVRDKLREALSANWVLSGDDWFQNVLRSLSASAGPVPSAWLATHRAYVVTMANAFRDSVLGMEAGAVITTGRAVPAGTVLWGAGEPFNAIWTTAEVLAAVFFPDIPSVDHGLGPRRVA